VNSPIRVVLVEDNDIFRQGLEMVLALRSDIEVAASVDDGEDAAAIARRIQPDVVLMDYRLPGIDGIQATAAVKAASPATAVICLTAEANERERSALYEAGAVACVTKDEDLDEIVAVIQRAAGYATPN
jgi:DNA-binding NarL/FixJ family response regulator